MATLGLLHAEESSRAEGLLAGNAAMLSAGGPTRGQLPPRPSAAEPPGRA